MTLSAPGWAAPEDTRGTMPGSLHDTAPRLSFDRLVDGGEPDARALLPRFTTAVSSDVGIVRLLAEERDYYNDEPATLLHRAEVVPTHRLSSSGYTKRAAEGGRGFDAGTTTVGALFEAFERYSLSVYREEHLLRGSHEALTAQGAQAVAPSRFLCARTATENERRRVDGTERAWVRGTSVATGSVVLVPAQTVFLPYYVSEDEGYLRDPLTTGAAAGLAPAAAARRGLLEAVERDAVMLMHYLNLVPDALDAGAVNDDRLLELLRDARRHHLEIRLFRVPTDLPVHVVVAQVLDRSGVGPEMTVGSKASLSLSDAMVGAVLEAICFRRGLRDRLDLARQYAEQHLRTGFDINCLEERTYYWMQPGRSSRLSYLEDAGAPADPGAFADRAGSMRGLVEELLDRVGDIVLVDVTTDDVRELGVSVMKAVVPELQPMHLAEPLRIFTRRLLSLGARHGQETPELNDVPHPFL
ncbi:YcaO-like family protein [Streptomyces griseoluteus]|uniref:YcaO-like family protein n=1 Tax=Streptomyces griseoluteus TaxID=29306 RepID=UPI0036EFDF8D